MMLYQVRIKLVLMWPLQHIVGQPKCQRLREGNLTYSSNAGKASKCLPIISAHLTDSFALIVEHLTEDFSGHDEAAGVRIDCDIPCHQTHITKLLEQLPVFLHSE